MFSYYLKTIYRHSLRHKLFTSLNIIGLALGMTVCLLTALYVRNELSYDRFQQDADRIFRVDMSFIWGNTDEHFGSTPPPVVNVLQNEFPEIESVTRIYPPNLLFFTVGDETNDPKAFEEEKVLAVDSSFLDVFALKVIKGNLKNALKKQNTAVLTQEQAFKYFQTENAIGRQFTMNRGNQKITIEVGGIVEALPEQSHFDFDMLLSETTFPEVKDREQVWIWTGFVTYLKLKPNADAQQLQQKIQQLPSKYASASLQRIYGYTFDDYVKQGKKWELFLLPLTDIHLFSNNSDNRLGTTGDIHYIYLLISIGLLVMALAVINFVNLSTARASQRTREVGVHKVLGSGKRGLIQLFLMESFLFGTIAMLIALAITEVLSPYFSLISGKHLSLLVNTNLSFFLLLVGFTILVSMLAGCYPAFYLSSFQPVKALKKKVFTERGEKAVLFRNGLVTFQFAISIGLIIFTLIIHRQLDFVRNEKLGFTADNVIILHYAEQIPNNADQLMNKLLQDSRIASASVANSMPPEVNNEDNFSAYGSDRTGIPINTLVVDEKYLPTLNIELLVGRNFEEGSTADLKNVIINKEAAQALGWSADPAASNYAIGQILEYPEQNYEVIGLTNDFSFQSLRTQVKPLALFYEGGNMWTGERRFIAVRPEAGYRSSKQIQQLLTDLGNDWKEVTPTAPFKYSFLDQDYFAAFESETRLGQIFTCLTVLALLIACLGLFGLMTFVVERKQKEIGIRKVLGATVPQIFLGISSHFSKLVLLALIITSPLAWYLTNQWLQTFQHKTNIPLWIFLVAGIGVFVISLASVSFQSIKAALANPVESLKNE